MSEIQSQQLKPRKPYKVFIITGLILLAIISGIFGYNINQYLTIKPNSSSIVEKTTKEIENKVINPKPESSLPSLTTPPKPETWTGEITLKPKNIDLVKSVDVFRSCLQLGGGPDATPKNCSSPGLVYFTPTDKSKGQMQIANLNSAKFETKPGISQSTIKEQYSYFFSNIDLFLQPLTYPNEKSTDLEKKFGFQIYNYCNPIFNNGCADGGGPFNITTLKKVELKGSDIAVASVLDTYRSGNLFVAIIAKKGDNIIQINSDFDRLTNGKYENLLKQFEKECETKFPVTQVELNLNPWSKSMNPDSKDIDAYNVVQQNRFAQIARCKYSSQENSKEIQDLYNQKTQELLTTFALE
jgi:hypothetical protein